MLKRDGRSYAELSWAAASSGWPAALRAVPREENTAGYPEHVSGGCPGCAGGYQRPQGTFKPATTAPSDAGQTRAIGSAGGTISASRFWQFLPYKELKASLCR